MLVEKMMIATIAIRAAETEEAEADFGRKFTGSMALSDKKRGHNRSLCPSLLSARGHLE
jgi:hypothetical protein